MTIIGRETKIEEILGSCRLDADHTETFKFVAPRTPLDKLVELFSGIRSHFTRTGAVFVTASGKGQEPF